MSVIRVMVEDLRGNAQVVDVANRIGLRVFTVHPEPWHLTEVTP